MRVWTLGLLLALYSSVASATIPMAGLASERLSSSASENAVESVSVAPMTQNEAASSASLSVLAVAGVAPTETHSPVSEAQNIVAQTHAGTPEEPAPVQATAPGPISVEALPQESAPEVDGTNVQEVLPDGDIVSKDELAEYERLFGEEANAPVGTPVEIDSGLSMWIWPLALLTFVGAWYWRKKKGVKTDTRDEINIVGRASLGREGSLAVIEVEDSEGQPRRLLVGYGGGAPRLVADLADTDQGLVSNGFQGSGRVEARDTVPEADSWERAIKQAETGLEGRRPSTDLIANVLADRDQVRKSLGELPPSSRAGSRRRAYRGTMA